MFNKERVLINCFIWFVGAFFGLALGYIRGQESRQNQINTLLEQLKTCNSTTNNVEIGKVKGKGTAEIIQKLGPTKQTPYSPYSPIFECKQDTNGIIKYFCALPRNQRRKIEKDLD